MFVENFTRFLKYYGKGFKIKLFCIFILSLIAGFFEMAGVALVYPFILLILNPSAVTNNPYYIKYSHMLKLNDPLLMAMVLGTFVILLLIIKNIYMIGFAYIQNKFVTNWKYAISKRFMHYYLYTTYNDTLSTTYSEKIYNIQFLVGQVIDGFIFRIINLLTNVVIMSMIIVLLFTKFLFAGIVTVIFVSVSVVFHNKIFKKKTKANSEELLKTSQINSHKTNQCIKNIKEIKISSAEEYFFNEFLDSQRKYNDALFKNSFYVSIPPYIVESITIAALLVLAGIVSIQNFESHSLIVASYAIIAAAIFRIAPALNRVQTSLNAINSSRDFVKTIIKRYDELNLAFVEEVPYFDIRFENSIKLENINFAYKQEPVIKDLNLEIRKGEFIGIIGLSGVGKSTLVDIMMGLLPVSSGKIFVDDSEISQSETKAMRKLIGYVPQQINVIDGSFKSNVAFGVAEKDIDNTKVIDALRKARLYEVANRYEEGIDANVIIDSAGLSQGQKQRLAIARALYRDSEIIILDEATSSLDVEVEHDITAMLTELKGEKTIIAIAHRLSTLKNCDRLIYMNNGTVIDIGTFGELSGKYPDFERLVNYSKI